MTNTDVVRPWFLQPENQSKLAAALAADASTRRDQPPYTVDVSDSAIEEAFRNRQPAAPRTAEETEIIRAAFIREYGTNQDYVISQ